MVRRHPFPKLWLFSDDRRGVDMACLAALLPPGSGIVVRHDGLAPGVRWRLVRQLMRIARARHLLLLLAGPPGLAQRWGAHGAHLRQPMARRAAQAHRIGLIVTLPVHDAREARRARRACADGVFISPLHPTRSHPGAPALGRRAWLRLARLARAEAVALGGMTPVRARQLRRASTSNPAWAAIGAWEERAARKIAARRQKRNAVPT